MPNLSQAVNEATRAVTADEGTPTGEAIGGRQFGVETEAEAPSLTTLAMLALPALRPIKSVSALAGAVARKAPRAAAVAPRLAAPVTQARLPAPPAMRLPAPEAVAPQATEQRMLGAPQQQKAFPRVGQWSPTTGQRMLGAPPHDFVKMLNVQLHAKGSRK